MIRISERALYNNVHPTFMLGSSPNSTASHCLQLLFTSPPLFFLIRMHLKSLFTCIVHSLISFLLDAKSCNFPHRANSIVSCRQMPLVSRAHTLLCTPHSISSTVMPLQRQCMYLCLLVMASKNCVRLFCMMPLSYPIGIMFRGFFF